MDEAEPGPHERLEADRCGGRPHLLQGTLHESEMHAAHDVGVLQRDVPEGTPVELDHGAVHAGAAAVLLGRASGRPLADPRREPHLVEQRDDALHAVFGIHRAEPRTIRPDDRAAPPPPGLSGSRPRGGRTPDRRTRVDRAREDPSQQLVGVRLGGGRRSGRAEQHARAAGCGPHLDRAVDETGLDELVQMGAHGVVVQTHVRGDGLNVLSARAGAQHLEDGHPAHAGKRLVGGEVDRFGGHGL